MISLETVFAQWDLNRQRTLATLDLIEKLPDPMAALGWRPGPGRAHSAWQLMHIAITEELFATERFLGSPAAWQDLVARFKGGSTPDDQITPPGSIRDHLAQSREHLLTTVKKFSPEDLGKVPEALKARNLTIGNALFILAWHEAHHQGQMHITQNLFKQAHGI